MVQETYKNRPEIPLRMAGIHEVYKQDLMQEDSLQFHQASYLFLMESFLQYLL